MTAAGELWFDPGRFGWVPAFVMGVLAVVFRGGAAVVRTRADAAAALARLLAVWSYWTALGVGSLLLLLGAAAWRADQPVGIPLCLALPEILGVIVMAAWFPIFRRLTG